MEFTQFYKNIETTLETSSGDSKITISGVSPNEGLTLDYDLLTTAKQFKIDPTGAHWNNGTTTYNTTLEELAALQTTFQAVELPPNATTLKVVDKVLATKVIDPLILYLFYFKPEYLSGGYLKNQGISQGYDLLMDASLTLSQDGVLTFPATDTVGPQIVGNMTLSSYYSVGCWLNLVNNGNGFIFYSAPGGGNTDRISFSIGGTGLLTILNYSGNTAYSRTFQSVITDTWFHVCAVVNGADWLVYVNGVPQSSTTAVVINNPPIVRSNSWVGKGSTAGNVNGSMTNFFIYNEVVSQAQITYIYNRGHLAETIFSNDILLDASLNQITITDGTTTNTINKTGYTTRNSVQNSTHYLNFSDSSSTGVGAIQKTAGISCNPSTNTITATTFSGALSGTATNATNATIADDNSDTLFYPTFVNDNTGNLPLKVDKTTNPLSYNPSTGVLSSTQLTATTQVNTPLITNTGDIDITTGSSNSLDITTNNIYIISANMEQTSAGADSGKYLRINLNGTFYRIKLFANS
jgi:hypothetical protein